MQVQRGHYFAIVDEVDSVLIDEARTPLIISGPVTVSTHQFDRYKPIVEQLVRRQNNLCARLITEAKELFEKGDTEEAGRSFTWFISVSRRTGRSCVAWKILRCVG